MANKIIKDSINKEIEQRKKKEELEAAKKRIAERNLKESLIREKERYAKAQKKIELANLKAKKAEMQVRELGAKIRRPLSRAEALIGGLSGSDGKPRPAKAPPKQAPPQRNITRVYPQNMNPRSKGMNQRGSNMNSRFPTQDASNLPFPLDSSELDFSTYPEQKTEPTISPYLATMYDILGKNYPGKPKDYGIPSENNKLITLAPNYVSIRQQRIDLAAQQEREYLQQRIEGAQKRRQANLLFDPWARAADAEEQRERQLWAWDGDFALGMQLQGENIDRAMNRGDFDRNCVNSVRWAGERAIAPMRVSSLPSERLLMDNVRNFGETIDERVHVPLYERERREDMQYFASKIDERLDVTGARRTRLMQEELMRMQMESLANVQPPVAQGGRQIGNAKLRRGGLK